LLIISKNQLPRLDANTAQDVEKATIADFFTNIDSIKYFGKEQRVKNIFKKKIDDTQKKQLRTWNYYKYMETGQSLIMNIGFGFLFYFPLIKFLDGGITIGTLAFIYTVYGNAMEPLFGFVWGVRRFYDAMADAQDLFEYDKIKNDIEDKDNAKTLKIKEGSIQFKDVGFAYHSRDVIKDFNLKIHPHEKVAFVGHSGSGKTTIVKLIYRLYDTKSGEILVDGRNIKDFKQESLRSELSIVPQECILFDDTIYSNIAFSRPHASREEVMQAIKFAQLDNFISNLPDKENTIVGERGVKLSGGEKQRVSIARAILANKKVLILDEATSALDSKTEHEIQQDLERLMKGRTSIIIAHRLSTIMEADKIVVLDHGKIAQIGSHNELIKIKGIYRELWSLQKGGYIN
jgi:ATP-binding cassette subfamily B protein